MIQLTGLTRRQVDILNVIWNIDSMEEVEEYISGLQDNDQRECHTLMNLIALELIDQAVEKNNNYSNVLEILDKYSKHS